MLSPSIIRHAQASFGEIRNYGRDGVMGKVLKGLLVVAVFLGGGFFGILYQHNQKKDSTTNKVIEFAESELEDRQTYWFEMKSLNIKWDPVILIFGYGVNNKSVCDFLLEHGRKTSPDRSFRCRQVR